MIKFLARCKIFLCKNPFHKNPSPSQSQDFWDTKPDFDGPARPTISDDGKRRIWVPDPPTFSISPSATELEDDQNESSIHSHGIQLFLDLSTCHLPERDFEAIQAWHEDSPIRVVHHEYGLIMFISGAPAHSAYDPSELDEYMAEKEIPAALKEIIRYARMHNCWLINFDRDAEKIDRLESYDW